MVLARERRAFRRCMRLLRRGASLARAEPSGVLVWPLKFFVCTALLDSFLVWSPSFLYAVGHYTRTTKAACGS